MGEIIRFPTQVRVGNRVRDVPFRDVAHQVARLLAAHDAHHLDCMLSFSGAGRATIIVGWREVELLALLFDSGPMHEFEEILNLYYAGVANGTEENPCLVTFYKASAAGAARWALASEEFMKFPLEREVPVV